MYSSLEPLGPSSGPAIATHSMQVNTSVKFVFFSYILRFYELTTTMLNYRQLHYFWVVAKTGSIVRACEQLNLTPQTISGQISLLEQTFGIALFQRVGRQLN